MRINNFKTEFVVVFYHSKFTNKQINKIRLTDCSDASYLSNAKQYPFLSLHFLL